MEISGPRTCQSPRQSRLHVLDLHGRTQGYDPSPRSYNNASANGRELSKEHLSGVEKLMTPEQIAEAMKLAREIFERIQAKKK